MKSFAAFALAGAVAFAPAAFGPPAMPISVILADASAVIARRLYALSSFMDSGGPHRSARGS